ncbi:hypothetical protein GCM10010129_63330 [Streptomyces fumigatiscleroticus]|nr:hypothetical protein GCM10010129_63330 [Streptomyces fumigatiscleroticus]
MRSDSQRQILWAYKSASFIDLTHFKQTPDLTRKDACLNQSLSEDPPANLVVLRCNPYAASGDS